MSQGNLMKQLDQPLKNMVPITKTVAGSTTLQNPNRTI